MAHVIVTPKLRDHGITEQTEFTPEQFVQYQAQFDAILAQEELENQPPEPDPVKIYENAVQMHMEAAARAARFDSLASVISYVGDTEEPLWAAQGLAFKIWRTKAWKKCYAILDEVKASPRPAPTIEEVIAELPVLILPE